MQISVIRPDELGVDLISRWREIQESDPAFDNPFLSAEFTCAVGELQDRVRVAVLEDGPDVVGFFPFEQHPFGVGKPVAAGLTDAQGLLLAKGAELDPRIVKRCGLAVYEFDHLMSGQPLAALGPHERHPSPVIDMRRGFADYVETIKRTSNKTYKSTLYKSRKLQRQVGPLHYDHATTSVAALTTLIGWKTLQYRRTGRADRFANRWLVELVERLCAIRSDYFAGVLDMMYVDGRPMAGHFGLRTKTTLVGWFPAYDVAFAKYSPGLMQHLTMAERSAAAGIQIIDLGRGDGEYKEKLKNAEFTVAEGRIADSGVRSAVHWVTRVPARKAAAAVVADPRLRRTASRTLKEYGRVRSRLS
ncbi:GNAT family N-acetyltransferase [Mycolicibacterium sp.]|uniref:GNAT family N-acetyltransferase n=1 Tax=Mycolicibacterium sp. TaxID=2320850 RepID=UPI001A1AF9D8|nr:GNAT family N-acetyltransferase [Mycolicibacterium sp.]MBJ7337669.1 GNAT family N-acetyltransferase [Mycolicibacterium sp.]